MIHSRWNLPDPNEVPEVIQQFVDSNNFISFWNQALPYYVWEILKGNIDLSTRFDWDNLIPHEIKDQFRATWPQAKSAYILMNQTQERVWWLFKWLWYSSLRMPSGREARWYNMLRFQAPSESRGTFVYTPTKLY